MSMSYMMDICIWYPNKRCEMNFFKSLIHHEKIDNLPENTDMESMILNV